MERNKLIWGVVLVFIGLILLGRTLDWFDFSFGDFFRTVFPLALILLGIWLIVRRKRHEEHISAQVKTHTQATFQQPTTGATAGAGPSAGNFTQAESSGAAGIAGRLKFSKLFGDMPLDCRGMNLRNVEVSLGFGDAEIKVHGGVLSPGLNRLIVSGFIGDIRIYLPADMPHLAHCSNFIGDLEAGPHKASGFSNTVDSQSANYESSESKLYIAANNFIGDIKIFVI
jgi:lia operon protein LiaF